MQQQRAVAERIETTVPAAGLAGTKVTAGGLAGIERARVEAVVETLANVRGQGESLAEVAHDARNMVTALGLYCDLLEEPGVLNAPFLHYGNELRLVAAASRRLVEKLLSLDLRLGTAADRFGAARLAADPVAAVRLERVRRWEQLPAEPIDNLSAELLANRNLLAALAGPSITVTVDIEGGALPVALTGEDLTRILVNLVKNSAEAMPEGGRIQLGLRELSAGAYSSKPSLLLTVEDSGPGIPSKDLEKIFESGYSTRSGRAFSRSGLPASQRGLGLSISRSIVEAAGGRIQAANRAASGACLEIELPVNSR